jgi:hypothetical protein
MCVHDYVVSSRLLFYIQLFRNSSFRPPALANQPLLPFFDLINVQNRSSFCVLPVAVSFQSRYVRKLVSFGWQ